MSDHRDDELERRVQTTYRAAGLPDAPEALWTLLGRLPVGPAARLPSRRFGGGPAARLVPVLLLVALAGGIALIAGSAWRTSPAPEMTTAPASADVPVSPTASAASVSPSAVPAVSPAEPGVVAWSPETPVPPTAAPTAAPPHGPPCRAADLEIGRAFLDGATGSLAGGFTLANTGPRACVVEGVPRVELVDGGGRTLPVSQADPGSRRGQPVELEPGQAVPNLRAEPPPGVATVFLVWMNWCHAAPVGPVRFRVWLPDGSLIGRARADRGGNTPRCDSPGAASTLSVDPFRATDGPEATEPPALPVSSLSGHLELPDEAAIGQPLRYVMVITNPTSAAIVLQPCPAYQERLSLNVVGRDVVEEHVLNCAGLPPIAPGSTVRFEMILDIPTDLEPTDSAAVVWVLDPWSSSGWLPPTPPEDKAAIRLVMP